MKTAPLLALALMLTATGCAVQTGAARPDGTDPDVVDAQAAPLPDARPVTPPTPPAPTPDAGHADALPARGEAGTDAGHPVTADAQPVQPEASSRDSALVQVDAAHEASTSGSASVDAAIADVARDYAFRPCSPEGSFSCGTIADTQNGQTNAFTVPMVCHGGAWGLAWGALFGRPPSYSFDCTHACGFQQLCAP